MGIAISWAMINPSKSSICRECDPQTIITPMHSVDGLIAEPQKMAVNIENQPGLDAQPWHFCLEKHKSR